MADIVSNLSNGDWLPSFMSGLLQPSEIAQTQAQTAQTQANIPMLQAQTQGLQLQNQWTQQQLQGLPSLLGGGGSSGPSAPPTGGTGGYVQPSPVGGAGLTDADIENAARRGFAPLPATPTPDVMQRALGATILYKNPAAGDLIKQQYTAQVGAQNTLRAQAADQAYVNSQSVDSAPPGQAFAVLTRLAPQLADQLKEVHGDDTPAQLDADTRLYAQHWGLQVHQYGTRGSHIDNGTLVDNVDQKPVLGSAQILTGLNSADKQKTFDDANSMVSLGGAAPVPKYRAAGFPSAEAYVIATDKLARTSAAAQSAASPPTSAPAPSTATASPGGNLMRPATARAPAQPNPSFAPVQVTAQRAGAVAPPAAPASAVASPNGPPLANFIQQAPNAPRWALDNTVAPPQDGSADTYKAARTSLVADANGLATTQQDIVKQQRLLSSIDSSLTGPGSGSVAAVQTWLKNLTGNDYARLVNSNPAARQILEKLAGQESIDQRTKEAREDGNSSIRFGAQMAGIYQKMSANPDMDPRAMRTIAGWDLQQDQYDAHRQQAAGMWLGANKDPTLFPHYYSSAYPLGNAVSSSLPAAATVSGSRTVVRTGMYNGQKVAQFSDGTVGPAP